MAALPADDRPIDPTPIHTVDLPPTPTRDRNIPATAWHEAPVVLLTAGDELTDPDGSPVSINYKRRIGDWLLWRAGRATRAHARYVAIRSDDLTAHWVFRLWPDGTGSGIGPSGETHTRFRTWKQDLLGS